MNHISEQKENINKQNSAKGTIILSIPTIHCQGCVDNIKNSLLEIKGIERAEGNPQLKIITINFDEHQVTTGQIEKTVTKNGHQLKSIRIV